MIPLDAQLSHTQTLAGMVDVVDSAHLLVVFPSYDGCTDVDPALMSGLPPLHDTDVGRVECCS